MSDVTGSFDFIYNYVEKDTFIKYFRLVVCVCGYILVRGLYMNWATKYHVQQQVKRDEEIKELEKKREAEEAEKAKETLVEEAKTFGWGKKTRKNNKLKEAYIEQQAMELRERHQSAYDAAEDNDIEDLLED